VKIGRARGHGRRRTETARHRLRPRRVSACCSCGSMRDLRVAFA
jgi:hypothetical protein